MKPKLKPFAWFGADWGGAVCDEDDHIDTPVGESCLFCCKPIGHLDQGITMPHVGWDEATGSSYVTVRASHLDCQLERILPHGPGCEHCRGMEREQHAYNCNYRTRGGDGNCDCWQALD